MPDAAEVRHQQIGVIGVAKEKKLPLNDLRKAFIEYWKKNNPENKDRGFLTYDGNHWTETGHKFVAEQMLKKFK